MFDPRYDSPLSPDRQERFAEEIPRRGTGRRWPVMILIVAVAAGLLAVLTIG